MKQRHIQSLISPAYHRLLIQIKQHIEDGSSHAKTSATQEKMVTFWHIGRLVYMHLMENKKRAEYGSYAIKQLAHDLHLTPNSVYKMKKFYESYPNVPQKSHLTWAHYKILSSIKDKTLRDTLEMHAETQKLSQRVLEQLAKKERGFKEKPNQDMDFERLNNTIPMNIPMLQSKSKHLFLKRGLLYVYKMLRFPYPHEPVLDCGFGIFRKIPLSEFSYIQNINKQDFYCYVKNEKGFFEIKPVSKALGPKIAHTYKAFFEKIIDSTTLLVRIDIGFGMFTKQKICLRGINTSTIKEGNRILIKRFIEKTLRNNDFFVIKTYYHDTCTYLGDVFYLSGEKKDAQRIAEKGIFLNQELINQGLAEKNESANEPANLQPT